MGDQIILMQCRPDHMPQFCCERVFFTHTHEVNRKSFQKTIRMTILLGNDSSIPIKCFVLSPLRSNSGPKNDAKKATPNQDAMLLFEPVAAVVTATPTGQTLMRELKNFRPVLQAGLMGDVQHVFFPSRLGFYGDLMGIESDRII